MLNLQCRRSFLKRSVLAVGVALLAPQAELIAAETLSGVSATSKNSSGLTVKWNRYGDLRYVVSYYKVCYKFDSNSTYARTVKSGTSTTLSKSGWKKCKVYVVAYGHASTALGTPRVKELARSSTYTFSRTTKKLVAPTWKSVTKSGKKITLKWNAVSNAGSYTVEYKSGSCSWKTLKSGLKTTSYSCTGTIGASYTFRLYANSSSSNYSKSDASATKTVNLSGQKLGTPSLSLVTGKSNQIYVSFAAAKSDYTEYVLPPVYAIQYRKNGASSWKTIYVEVAPKKAYPMGVPVNLRPNNGSYILKGLTNNATYQFRVKAFSCRDLQNKGYENSNWSSTKSAKVKKGSYWGYGGRYTATFVDYNVARNSYYINL